MKKEIYPQKLINDYDLLLSAYTELYKLREKVAETIKQHLDNSKKPIILEIGCGTGETTEVILKQTANIKIIAVDIDASMISKLNQNLKIFIANGRLKSICQDVFEYIQKLADASFDGLTSSWAIHNFDKNKRNILLHEIYRILKPNGIFVNMDKYVLDSPLEEQKSFNKVVKQLNKISKLGRPDIAELAIRHEDEDRHPEYIMKEKESIKLMQEIGFKNIKILKRINREAVLFCLK